MREANSGHTRILAFLASLLSFAHSAIMLYLNIGEWPKDYKKTSQRFKKPALLRSIPSATSMNMPNFTTKSKGLSISLPCRQETTDHADQNL
ncbi:MAG: hypothetical protein H8E79_04490 [Desulfobulbaceae bacterium]|uniref:Uncharacterized protein n=1 Tax=Candidatus Desulfatifera sulfidica TaxID=2841691 RepID=A0A8J6N999_9BACT|nr:hypothetical protein [Candidatus Desulfatifera sulfidica]